ncbi:MULTISPECIES: SURF1 family protein [unclassified Roseateles]|uniref:SURF1 family protein n=1 Tax=unclassified Roseateles TaxID=2626991 RepID=UPI0006FC7BD6|nr:MULTISPECIES: SURF1 family protein [unclassified Roseateles]KQW51826.1 transmembrane cytochrome oxidase [Pelomonas sp. Root405]KRA78059.1 transmembrane cytochrome oxidase [Pelomonas sp. Root662]
MLSRRGWLVLVAAVLSAALTARLGFWQLDRAAYKLELQSAIDAQAERPALGNAELDGAELHRRVVLRGTWATDHAVWLDNRPMDGRVGFFVVTPLRLAGRADAILVQRGWAPRHSVDRKLLPPLTTPTGEVEVVGRLAASPSRLYELGEGSVGAIRQNLDPVAFGAEAGLSLLPLTVVQTSASVDDGLLRHWPAPELGLHKHYGYAFQWFALCALILVLYVWFQIVRPRLRQQQP